jgi:hypothetical protein
MITATLFADNPMGEIPFIPENVACLPTESEAALLEEMRAGFLEGVLLNPELMQTLTPHLSPYFFSVCIWSMLRWIATYACARSENGCPSLCQAFSVSPSGAAQPLSAAGAGLVDVFIRLLAHALVNFSGESAVLAQVANGALYVSRSPVLGAAALSGESWASLTYLCVPSDGSTTVAGDVPCRIHMKLMQSLVNAGDLITPQNNHSLSPVEHFEATRQVRLDHFSALVAPLDASLHPLLEIAQRNKPDELSALQQPAVLQSVLIQVSRLRGVARASISDEALVFRVCMQYFSPLLTLLEVYRGNPDVVAQIVLFFKDFAEYQAENLSDGEDDGAASAHTVFFASTQSMFEAWNKIHGARVSIESSASSRALVAADVDAQARDVSTQLLLLRVMTGLCTFFEFDESGLPADDAAAQLVAVIARGIEIVLPHVSHSLLEFPKLRSALFGLVHSLLADCLLFLMPVLPEPSLRLVVSIAADLGLSHFDSDVVRLSLEALGGLGRFVFEGGHSQQFAELVNGVLGSVMQFVFFGDFSRGSLPPCAEALLPLVLCAQDSFAATVQELIARHAGDAAGHARVAMGFESLLAGVVADLSFSNRKQFEKNLEHMLVSTKGLVALK